MRKLLVGLAILAGLGVGELSAQERQRDISRRVQTSFGEGSDLVERMAEYGEDDANEVGQNGHSWNVWGEVDEFDGASHEISLTTTEDSKDPSRVSMYCTRQLDKPVISLAFMRLLEDRSYRSRDPWQKDHDVLFRFGTDGDVIETTWSVSHKSDEPSMRATVHVSDNAPRMFRLLRRAMVMESSARPLAARMVVRTRDADFGNITAEFRLPVDTEAVLDTFQRNCAEIGRKIS